MIRKIINYYKNKRDKERWSKVTKWKQYIPSFLYGGHEVYYGDSIDTVETNSYKSLVKTLKKLNIGG